MLLRNDSMTSVRVLSMMMVMMRSMSMLVLMVRRVMSEVWLCVVSHVGTRPPPSELSGKSGFVRR